MPPFDAHHPSKSLRPGVDKTMSAALVYLEYALLAIAGLAAAAAVSKMCLVAGALFLLTGLTYNVEPLRTKDHAYLDVMTESLGNPIRLLLGWAIVAPTTLPPSSLVLAYWMGGAFLMAVKRLAEYRTIVGSHGVEVLGTYRRSFRHYTAERLLILSFLCGQMAAFFIAVFLIKYRIEYLLSFPLFALLFAAYLRLGLKRGSNAQTPERLFEERLILIVAAVLVVTLAVLSVVDIPSFGIFVGAALPALASKVAKTRSPVDRLFAAVDDMAGRGHGEDRACWVRGAWRAHAACFSARSSPLGRAPRPPAIG